MEIPPLKDRAACTVALSRILDAVANARITPRRAGIMLHAVQMALQQLDRTFDAPPKLEEILAGLSSFTPTA